MMPIIIIAPWISRTRICHSLVLASGPIVNRSTSAGHCNLCKLNIDNILIMYTKPLFCTIGSLYIKRYYLKKCFIEYLYYYFFLDFKLCFVKVAYLTPTRVWNRVLMPAIIMVVDSKYAWAGSSGKIQNFGAKTLATKIKLNMVVIVFCE